MGTFLTTSRMAPELVARIEASVRGERGARGAADGRATARKARLIAIARVALVVAIVGAVGGVVALRRRDRRELEASRSALLATVHAASASITPIERESIARAESWLTRSSGPYEGDFVADGLGAADALTTALARPALYLRGPIAQLTTARGIAEAAATSVKDPLLVCLLQPPAARTEKAVLTKVREAYGREAEGHSPTVRRFGEALLALPFFDAAWGARVEAAKTQDDLDDLRDQFGRGPIDAGRRALKAQLLVFAIDEAGDPNDKTPTELDGERPHDVRVGIVDLVAGRLLLRIRKRVDPAWISGGRKALYAGGIDGCALAFDVREAVSGKH